MFRGGVSRTQNSTPSSTRAKRFSTLSENTTNCRTRNSSDTPDLTHISRCLACPASKKHTYIYAGHCKENYWDGNRRLSSIARDDDGGGRSRKYEESRTPLEDSDHLAVHSVHIFMQNLYNYATQNTVRDEMCFLHE